MARLHFFIECTTFAPATIATVVKHNPNPNHNPTLNPYPTPNQKPNHHLQSNSLLSEISSQEQLSPEQMSDNWWRDNRGPTVIIVIIINIAARTTLTGLDFYFREGVKVGGVLKALDVGRNGGWSLPDVLPVYPMKEGM